MKPFTGEMYKSNGLTWTEEYDQWRRDNHLCNSPMASVLMKRRERLENDNVKPPAPWWAYLIIPPRIGGRWLR